MGKSLLVASAIAMGIWGLVGLFAPGTMASWLAMDAGQHGRWALQIGSVLYLAFAAVNWTARDALIGGIYGRPIGLGNFLHFLMGSMVLLKAVMAHANAPIAVTLTIYMVFAVGFARLLFNRPNLNAGSAAESSHDN